MTFGPNVPGAHPPCRSPVPRCNPSSAPLPGLAAGSWRPVGGWQHRRCGRGRPPPPSAAATAAAGVAGRARGKLASARPRRYGCCARHGMRRSAPAPAPAPAAGRAGLGSGRSSAAGAWEQRGRSSGSLRRLLQRRRCCAALRERVRSNSRSHGSINRSSRSDSVGC